MTSLFELIKTCILSFSSFQNWTKYWMQETCCKKAVLLATVVGTKVFKTVTKFCHVFLGFEVVFDKVTFFVTVVTGVFFFAGCTSNINIGGGGVRVFLSLFLLLPLFLLFSSLFLLKNLVSFYSQKAWICWWLGRGFFYWIIFRVPSWGGLGFDCSCMSRSIFWCHCKSISRMIKAGKWLILAFALIVFLSTCF